MKIKCICLTVIINCCVFFLFAQKKNLVDERKDILNKIVYGYKLIDDNIVFSYTVSKENNINLIKSITIAGSFNNWNPDDVLYKLTLKSNGIFELTLPKSQFEKDRLYTFKFVMNGDNWLNVPANALNIDGSHYGNLTFDIDSNSTTKSDSINIVPNYNKITSVSELLDACKGQAVFIDYWGTWCSPCLEAFNYSDSLHAFLKKKGIKIIYVCTNYNSEDSVWRNTIAKYKLAGYHVRACQYLEDDLALLIFGFVTRGSLPHYLLFNDQKVLLSKDLPTPSSNNELYKQIERIFK